MLKHADTIHGFIDYATSDQSIVFSGQYKNAEVAVRPLFLPVNCYKIKKHVALMLDVPSSIL